MRRILRVMAVALVMAAMTVVMAGAASAQEVEFFEIPCLGRPESESGKVFGSFVVTPGGDFCTGGTPLGPTAPPQDL